jgi:hypothetical protein
MNRHDSSAIANLHTDNAIIRGKGYTISEYQEKQAKAFQKHPDFKQTFANDIYVTPLQAQNGYALIFDETFTQNGKSTPTEIMIVALRTENGYKINYESDISTDRNLIKKMGISGYTNPTSCSQLESQILIESPMFRYEYVPSNKTYSKRKSLSLVCEPGDCSVYVDELANNHYEIDVKAMKLNDYTMGDEYLNDVHPKYRSQINALCK